MALGEGCPKRACVGVCECVQTPANVWNFKCCLAMLGVLVAFILRVKLGKNVDHATYFCRFYGYVVKFWSKSGLCRKPSTQDPIKGPLMAPQREPSIRWITYLGTLFEDISALFPMCFLHVFLMRFKMVIFPIWEPTLVQNECFWRAFSGPCGVRLNM